MIDQTQLVIAKAPKVMDAIADEVKELNHKFSKQVVAELLDNLTEFKEALKKCEEDAKNPSNSLFVLQNFTNLLQVTYKTVQNLSAAVNFSDGLAAVQESFERIKKSIDDPVDK